jgi:hypothetical protein
MHRNLSSNPSIVRVFLDFPGVSEKHQREKAPTFAYLRTAMDRTGMLAWDMEADIGHRRAGQRPTQAKAIWARRESGLETDFFGEGD